MNPSEVAIERAVNGLAKSPGLFQRLVETFVEVEFPQFFPFSSPHGRNSYDVAIVGWPDITSGANAAEVTLAKDWRRHLREEINKASTRFQPELYIFVAWAKEPSSPEIARWKGAISDAFHIPPGRVILVFKAQLRRALTQPRFARQWVEILQLPSNCHPFVVLNSTAAGGGPSDSLFGRIGGPVSFLPTREDYRAGTVYRPPMSDAVETTLSKTGWALVRGSGASGKTVFALNIALGMRYLKTVSYYLSLYDAEDTRLFSAETAMNAIATRADQNVLFVIDDIHLDENLASTLFAHWREVHNGSQLLLLGRHEDQVPDPYGRLSPMANVEAFDLLVDAETLLGSFKRIVRPSDKSSLPPSPVLQQWLSLFRGDLIAFSAAVQSRCESLASRIWVLDARDAANYVRNRYLRGLPTRERQNLLRLAVSYSLHQPLPIEAVDDGDLTLSQRNGVVYYKTYGSRKTLAYTLVHEGVATLILAAAGSATNQLALIREIAKNAPIRGFISGENLRN